MDKHAKRSSLLHYPVQMCIRDRVQPQRPCHLLKDPVACSLLRASRRAALGRQPQIGQKEPVSYTHLDVYKRQLLYRPVWMTSS